MKTDIKAPIIMLLCKKEAPFLGSSTTQSSFFLTLPLPHIHILLSQTGFSVFAKHCSFFSQTSSSPVKQKAHEFRYLIYIIHVSYKLFSYTSFVNISLELRKIHFCTRSVQVWYYF